MKNTIIDLQPTTTTADSSPTLADGSEKVGGLSSPPLALSPYASTVQPLALPAIPTPLAPEATPPQRGWPSVKYYLTTAEKFQRCVLACQVMAGFELLELRKACNVKRGGDRRSNPNTTGLIDQTPWAEQVKELAGISDDTARKYISMAEACKPRLKKLDGFERLSHLLVLHPSQWTEDDSQLMFTAVHKITDGLTQLEFMWQHGLAKKPQGSGCVGGYHPADPNQPKLTLDEQLAQSQKETREEWTRVAIMLEGIGANWTALSDEEVTLQTIVLEQHLTNRRAWLQTPKRDRTPERIATIAKRISQWNKE